MNLLTFCSALSSMLLATGLRIYVCVITFLRYCDTMGEAWNYDLNFSNFNLASVLFLHLSSLISSTVAKTAFAVGINIFIMLLKG